MANIDDNAVYVYAYEDANGNTFVYGDHVVQYREEQAVKLATTDAAAFDGARLGTSFQGLRRIIVSGDLLDFEDGINNTPLRVLAQQLRTAHKRGDPGKLFLFGASDGRPAEYLVAQVENLTGLTFENPITYTEWEIPFLCEPEYWYDSLQTQSLLTGATGSGYAVHYAATVNYAGPATGFPADALGVPSLDLTVATIDTGRSVLLVDNNVQIQNTDTGQVFTLYAVAPQDFTIDSYQETTRVTGTTIPFEALEHNGYLNLVEGNNHFVILCDGLTLSNATLTWKPRHF